MAWRKGMWACSRCDMDFCAKCGKEHISGSNYWLKSYNPSQFELASDYGGYEKIPKSLKKANPFASTDIGFASIPPLSIS